MSQDLPSFENPPVTEVALSVQFEPIEGLSTAQLGLLWTQFRDRFPRTSSHHLLEPVIEKFDAQGGTGPQVRFVANAPNESRLWFADESDSNLIQVQYDRFVRNWRRRPNSKEYPRYPVVREGFESDLELFCNYLKEQDLPPITPNQCEVTYVNHIERHGVWERHGQAGKILQFWNDDCLSEASTEPEEISFCVRYELHSADQRIGRLHIHLDPAFRVTDNEPIYILKLIARGRPESADIKGVMGFLDRGRKHIVRGFTSITTPEMHRAWGRKT